MFKDFYNHPSRAILAIAVAVLLPAMSYAQNDDGYQLVWSTVDGGGGRSEGGPYVLEATIGQADTGVSGTGAYVLSAGFWPGQFGCVVNLVDLVSFVEQWLAEIPGAQFKSANLDGIGTVDMADFAMLSSWWLARCPADWSLK